MREFTFIFGFLAIIAAAVVIALVATGQIHLPTPPAHH